MFPLPIIFYHSRGAVPMLEFLRAEFGRRASTPATGKSPVNSRESLGVHFEFPAFELGGTWTSDEKSRDGGACAFKRT